MDEGRKTTKNLPLITQFDKKKCTRFSEDVEKIESFYTISRDDDIFQDIDPSMDLDNMSQCSSDLQGYDEDSLNFLDNGDIDRRLLRNLRRNEEIRKSKERLSLPNIDESNIDSSVKHFVSEMSEFYNEMAGKLKSLRTCPVLENSSIHHLDPDDEKFMIEKKFNNLYKNLKKTPQMKKTLSLISKMDTDISETMSKFKEQKAERLDIQEQLIRKMPMDRESQLFLQLCAFEANSNKDQHNMRFDERQNEKNPKRRRSRTREDKNFVERNIELAKMGMNFPISDEQKQRLERLLKDNDGGTPPLPNIRSEGRPSTSESRVSHVDEDNIYQDCTLNAYRLSDDHKGRLIEIDSALQAFDEDQPRKPSETNIGTDLVRSLKEIDQKLKAISTSYVQDQERLEKNRKKPTYMNIDKIEEEEVLESTSDNTSCVMSTPKDM
ncbi:hypothetical protein WA026_003076 [Henosepilachna vigintioctopunctata]|uniref:Fibrous sheath-interacting protein 1 n=1 Tax=Henosepilachna vigintioctopunctata TaxID=420089 RepID=A0AAW1TH48_9CUCU